MKNFFASRDFVELMEDHSADMIGFLLAKGVAFSVLVSISEVLFEPEIPRNIKRTFKPITMFTVAGYTFETAEVVDNELVFEAGFGRENFGSLVTVPLHSIVQILVEDTPIYINLSRKLDEKKVKSKIERSKNIFLSNPENKKFIKK